MISVLKCGIIPVLREYVLRERKEKNIKTQRNKRTYIHTYIHTYSYMHACMQRERENGRQTIDSYSRYEKPKHKEGYSLRSIYQRSTSLVTGAFYYLFIYFIFMEAIFCFVLFGNMLFLILNGHPVCTHVLVSACVWVSGKFLWIDCSPMVVVIYARTYSKRQEYVRKNAHKLFS